MSKYTLSSIISGRNSNPPGPINSYKLKPSSERQVFFFSSSPDTSARGIVDACGNLTKWPLLKAVFVRGEVKTIKKECVEGE